MTTEGNGLLLTGGLASESWDAWALSKRLRQECGTMPDEPLEPSKQLPHCFPVECISIPTLSVTSLADWLQENQNFAPAGLQAWEDRRLRGAVAAFRGRGWLFADAADTPVEQRFAWMREAAHLLGDHYFPRLDAIALHGESVLEVIDEKRPPTAADRLDAALQSATLEQHIHLMARDIEHSTTPRVDDVEARADAFACEILAPFALLVKRFPDVEASFDAVASVQSTLAVEFQLPLIQATQHARAFVATHGRKSPLS